MIRKHIDRLILAGILTCLPLGVTAQESVNYWGFVSRKVDPASVATREELKTLYKTVSKEFQSRRSDNDSIERLNRELRRLGLPLINSKSPELKIELPKLIGAFDSESVGVEIRDGNHRFCLPCQIGHNSFKIGITGFRPSARNTEGRYHAALICFEAIQASYLDGLSGYVNRDNIPQTRFLPAVVNNGSEQGALILTDDSASFYEYRFPSDHASAFFVQIPNGAIAALRWNKNEYGSGQPSINEEFESKSDLIDRNRILRASAKPGTILQTLIVATLEQQMGRLLGPANPGYRPPSLKWRCSAIRACSKIKSELFIDRFTQRNFENLRTTWAQQTACED